MTQRRHEKLMTTMVLEKEDSIASSVPACRCKSPCCPVSTLESVFLSYAHFFVSHSCACANLCSSSLHHYQQLVFFRVAPPISPLFEDVSAWLLARMSVMFRSLIKGGLFLRSVKSHLDGSFVGIPLELSLSTALVGVFVPVGQVESGEIANLFDNFLIQ